MLIDRINLNHLRVFEAIFRSGSTISAASELGLTQSGISQHLKNLEGQLGQSLFDRINRTLVPTPFARILYRECHKGLGYFEHALSEILGEKALQRGTLSVGMPTEFGNNCVIDILSRFALNHPEVKLEIVYGLADTMNKELLEGKLDFAFVDDLVMSPRIIKVPIYEETVSLFASRKYMLKIKSSNTSNRLDLTTLDYIDYLPSAPMLKRWFKHHTNLRSFNLNIKATVHEVQGVSKLIFSHLGAGILPEHHVKKVDPHAKNLYRFKEKAKPLINVISIASLLDRTHSPVALLAVEEISRAIGKLKDRDE